MEKLLLLSMLFISISSFATETCLIKGTNLGEKSHSTVMACSNIDEGVFIQQKTSASSLLNDKIANGYRLVGTNGNRGDFYFTLIKD